MVRTYITNSSLFFHLEDLYFRGCLAKGRIGIIFRCTPRWSQSDDQQLAVKVTPLTKHSSNEVDVLWSLNHPNIIKFKGFIQGETQMYLITEYASGGDLLQYIQRQDPLNEKLAKTVMIQIVEAVHFMHSNGLAHRDLKLENFIIMQDIETPDQLERSTIKVIDLEFSIPCTPDYICNEPVGTKSYFSPQVEMRNYNPFKSDMWCLGICLYILLTGKPPPPSDGISQIYKNLPSDLSADLQDLMSKLLDPVEKDRITSQEFLDHDWFDEIQDTPHFIMKNIRRFFGTTTSSPPPSNTQVSLKSHRNCTAW